MDCLSLLHVSTAEVKKETRHAGDQKNTGTQMTPGGGEGWLKCSNDTIRRLSGRNFVAAADTR